MIGVLQVQVQAHSPNMPLCPCFAFRGSPSSLRIMGVPKSIGAWRITEVYATLHYPDDVETTKLAVREGNVYVATLDGCQTAGKVENGLTISANGIDEDGNAVTGYVLGRGDVYVMEGDSVVPDPTTVKNYVKLCDSLPETPSKGDAYFQNGMLVIYDGTNWVPSADITDKRDKLDLTVYEQTRAPFVERFKDSTTGEWVERTFVWMKLPPFETYMWWEDNEGPSTANKLNYEEGRGWTFGNGIGPMTVISTEPGDALVIHRQNVPDWTFTRQSIYETVSTEDRLAKVSEIHGDYIEDANGNKIEADGDITYLDDTKWSVKIGRYDYVLSPSGTDEWTYADAEGIPGNNKVVLKWVDYMQGWQLSYYQWDLVMAGWNVLSYGETYESPQATSLEIEITGDVSYTAECRKGAPSTGKLAKLSDIDNSHIEDANGNKIYANRTAYYMGDGTPYWTVIYNGENYQLSGTKESSLYYPDNPQSGDLAFNLDYNDYWMFRVYEWWDDGQDGYWFYANGWESYEGEDADELYYDDYSTDPPTQVKFAEWTTPQVLIQGELAVKSDLPTKTSDLTNDSGFVNQEQLSAKVNNDGGVAKVRKMTQAQYDALASKDSTTLYVITES